jgi:hypothetical protein
MAARGHKTRRERQSAPETPQAMRERVLGAFWHWLVKNEPSNRDPLAPALDDILDVVHTACELKASMLDEPNPADWSPLLTRTVIGEVFPAKTVGVTERYAAMIAPAMLLYVDFLVDTGRWKSHNDVLRSRQVLLGLADELPARFGDPSRETMASRLFGLALEEGIDLTDPAALSAFMERFNDMPYEWRKRLTDGPGLQAEPPFPVPNPPTQESGALREEAQRAITLGLSGLQRSAGEIVRVRVPAAAEEAAALRDMEFIRRIGAMVEWVGAGRPVTQTGAMRRTDTVEWMRRVGLRVRDENKPPSMWEIRDLGQPWSIAIETGMLEVTSTKVRPGPTAAVFDADDPIAQVKLGRWIVDVLLNHALSRFQLPEVLQPAVVSITLPLLAMLCRPQGQDIGYLRAIDARRFAGTDFVERVAAGVCSAILLELRALDHWGLVTDFDTTPRIPAALRPAVAAVINGPEAPLSVQQAKFSIPLVRGR